MGAVVAFAVLAKGAPQRPKPLVFVKIWARVCVSVVRSSRGIARVVCQTLISIRILMCALGALKALLNRGL